MHLNLRAFLFFLFFFFHTSIYAAVSSFAVIGDGGMWTQQSKLVRDSVKRAGIQNLILPGDNLYVGTDYDRIWRNWKQLGFQFPVVAIGNHHDTYANEVHYFKMPGEFYSVVPVPGVRFLVLNSDNEENIPQQMAFAENVLSSAHEPLLFVVYHHPTYTVTKTHTWDEKAVFQKRWRFLIGKYRTKISALLVGHDHIASLVSLNDLPMVVSGAIWETRKAKPVDYFDDGVHVKTQWLFDGTPHWVRLDTNVQSSQFKLSFVRASDDHVGSTRILRAPGL
jgi:hypothetical protein